MEGLKMIKYLYPKGLKKALTLSYDDGIQQDKKLVPIFNKYNLKATFNLNSGIQNENSTWSMNGQKIYRINHEEIKQLYKGHEVAVHSLTHPFLNKIPTEMIINEIFEDRKNLENLFGYPIRGMAYPYGAYNAKVIEVMKICGIEYSRTVNQHEEFILPENYLEWDPTCHHDNPKLMNLTKSFIDLNDDKLSIFYVWGHSYEFDLNNNWSLIEEFSHIISNKSDIWYATNIEIIDYLNAIKNVKFSADCSIVYNPNCMSVWLKVDEKTLEILAGKTVKL